MNLIHLIIKIMLKNKKRKQEEIVLNEVSQVVVEPIIVENKPVNEEIVVRVRSYTINQISNKLKLNELVKSFLSKKYGQKILVESEWINILQEERLI